MILLILATLIIADGWITEAIIGKGYGIEASQTCNILLSADALTIAKYAGAGIVVYFLYRWHKTKPKVSKWVTNIGLVLYGGLFIWNVSIYYLGEILC